MEEINLEQVSDVIEYQNNRASDFIGSEVPRSDDEIRFYVTPRRNRARVNPLRFVISTASFFLLFLCIAMLLNHNSKVSFATPDEQMLTDTLNDTEPNEDVSVAATPEEYKPIVIDETKTGIELILDKEYSLYPLMASSEGVKVLILHSHNSEYVSENLTVADAGDVIAQLLTSAGIKTYHCVSVHDANGNIGSYLRMKESLSELLSRYPEVVCVIDIHDSESGLPVTFTVGTDFNGWNENLKIGEAISAHMSNIETAFRFLPGSIGQDNGILTLNVGIGGANIPDEAARRAIALFAEAFIKICSEKASAP